ncbi:hypothetical protein [Streptomyces violascens]
MKSFRVWASGAGLSLTGLGVAGYLVAKALLEGALPPSPPQP